MAKSYNRSVDKLERKARLAGVQRQHEIEQREIRNMNRMGWQDFEQDESNEIDEMAGWGDEEA